MSGSRDDLVLLQSDERLWPRPWPAAGTPVHTWNREKSSFWRVCEFSRGDVSADCQGAGPDRVVHDQAVKGGSGEGTSRPQKADRQAVDSCKDLLTSSVHRLQPNP